MGPRIKSSATSVRCVRRRTWDLDEYVDDFENSFFRSTGKNGMVWCRSGADRAQNDREAMREKCDASRRQRQSFLKASLTRNRFTMENGGASY
jgi:hypothetical protein